MKEFRLIINSALDDWSGGWAAGSINAHYVHFHEHKKVFWFQGLRKAGLGKYKEFVEDNWDKIRKNFGKKIDDLFFSDIGYFYEVEEGSITWQFKIKKILTNDEISNSMKKYIPIFRKVYYDNYQDYVSSRWFLLTDLKRLKKPITFNQDSGFKFLNGNKLEKLNPQHHLRVTSFVSAFPRISERSLYAPEPEELQDPLLKELLIKGLTNREARLHETHVQNAIKLNFLNEGYKFSKEGIVELNKNGKKGRYDFLVKIGKIYYAIETKVDDDPNAASQLKEYIDAIVRKGKIPRDKIKGRIICGHASKATMEEARKKKFKVFEYKLNINVQDIIKKSLK